MPAVIIQDFRAGRDARHMNETTLPGALLEAENSVVNEGGEIERQKEWVVRHGLPAGTIGMQVFGDIINVYGSIDEPAGVPQKVNYNKLLAATGKAMIAVTSADLFEGLQYVATRTADGSIVHFYDGAEVVGLKDDRAFASFVLDSGTSGSVDSVKADGVEILSTPVAFDTSLEITAAAVVAAINDNISSPNYVAIQDGARIIVKDQAGGTGPNGFFLVPTVSTLIITIDTPVFEGGVNNAADIFRPGPIVRTIDSKMYFIVDSLLHFSNIGFPTQWDPNVGIGAGFIDMSNHSGGSQELTAIAEYFDLYAIFATITTQIWALDPDEDLNKKEQNVRLKGAFASGSVQAYGNDTVFLDRSGIRSLRARDSSRSANVSDIGTAIDPLIRNLILNSESDVKKSVSVIDPLTGRYILAIDKELFIFSLFPTNKISAWTTSKTTFPVEQMDQFGLTIVARSGNTIYQLGGVDGQTYGSDITNVRLPFIDAGDPSRLKKMFGVDFAVEGQWKVFLSEDVKDPTKEREIMTLSGSTFREGQLPINGQSGHISLRFESVGSVFGKLGRVVIHYKTGRQE